MADVQNPNDKINEIKERMADKKKAGKIMDRIKARFDNKMKKLKEDDPNVYPMF